MTGYSADWLDIIKPVGVSTVVFIDYPNKHNVIKTYDKYFIPSTEQLYGIPSYYPPIKQYLEDGQWEYIKEKSGMDHPSNAANSKRTFPYIVDKATIKLIRLRTASGAFSTGTVECCVNGATPGQIIGFVASAGYRTLPSCVIY